MYEVTKRRDRANRLAPAAQVYTGATSTAGCLGIALLEDRRPAKAHFRQPSRALPPLGGEPREKRAAKIEDNRSRVIYQMIGSIGTDNVRLQG
jgi:hypothetical protein